MPLNVPKNYKFVPAPVGAVRLTTRNSTRARLTNETHYRSYERGEQANLIKLLIVEDLTLEPGNPNEGLFVEHNLVLKPSEQIFAVNIPIPTVELYELRLAWNEEVRITLENEMLVAKKYGIRWQIAAGPDPFPPITLGIVTKNRVFSAGGITFKLPLGPADFSPTSVVYLRPRTRRYTLVPHDVTDSLTSIVSTGWDPSALRATVNADPASWVRLPERGTSPTPPTTDAEDKQDEEVDADFLVPFGPTPLKGGDGLPTSPGGNTGPDRALVHLNYSELEDGSLGEFNRVFEWVGDSSVVGSWQRYA